MLTGSVPFFQQLDAIAGTGASGAATGGPELQQSLALLGAHVSGLLGHPKASSADKLVALVLIGIAGCILLFSPSFS